MKKYAFFDVDKTIFKGYTENLLIDYIDQNDKFKSNPKKKLHSIKAQYNDRKIDYNQAVELVVDLLSNILKGYSVKEIDKIISNIFTNENLKFEEWFIQAYQLLQQKDYKLVLVSGTNVMIVKKLAEIIGEATMYFGTQYYTKNGYYTNEHENHMNGEEKKKVVKKILDENKNTFSIGFGDSPGDIPMLEEVDKAFIFFQEEHKEMVDVANDKGWVFFKKYNEIESILKNDIL